MTGHFSFSFAGDDIEDDGHLENVPPTSAATSVPAVAASAFPVQGKPLLPPSHHGLNNMLSRLPSKVAFGLMTVQLDDGRTIQLPRRELWDVRVQLMAEEEEHGDASESAPGIGEHDVKTGIYEGGFKSWESSVDLVKVLASQNTASVLGQHPCVSIELGCGTGLPSLALFQWALAGRGSGDNLPLVLTLADYNPTVLFLVTLPNLILTWALQQQGKTPVLEEAFMPDGELELTPEVLAAFKESLSSHCIELRFLSGGWSADFVDLLYSPEVRPGSERDARTLVLGAETIYSPFALESFAATLLSILEREKTKGQAAAIVGAKRLYFGVGGSLDDFIEKMKSLGTAVETMREEIEGVRRGVVKCQLS